MAEDKTETLSLDLDAIGVDLEPIYITYKKKQYRVSRPGEMPFGLSGKLRKAGKQFTELMDNYEDLQAVKNMIEIYIPDFPVDTLEQESSAVVSAITRFIIKIAKEDQTLPDPKSSSPSSESSEDTQD